MSPHVQQLHIGSSSGFVVTRGRRLQRCIWRCSSAGHGVEGASVHACAVAGTQPMRVALAATVRQVWPNCVAASCCCGSAWGSPCKQAWFALCYDSWVLTLTMQLMQPLRVATWSPSIQAIKRHLRPSLAPCDSGHVIWLIIQRAQRVHDVVHRRNRF